MRLFRSNTITFEPITEWIETCKADPVPASQVMPEWYKKLPRYINNSDKPIKSLGRKDVKTCVPFRDAMISGYMILLSADVEVAISETGDVDVFHNPAIQFPLVDKRGPLDQNHQGYGMPNPVGTTPIMFAWSATWGIGTDKSDSVLVTHPLNRHDLPFVTTSGIIDSGYMNKAGNIPFFIKEGFTGIIPKGTPIAQVLPFERQNWKSKKLPSNVAKYAQFMNWRDTYLEGFYSRFLRQPKSYK